MTPITRVWRADRHHSRPRNQGEGRAAPAEQLGPAGLICTSFTNGGDVGPAVMETVRQILAAPGDGQGRRHGDDDAGPPRATGDLSCSVHRKGARASDRAPEG